MKRICFVIIILSIITLEVFAQVDSSNLYINGQILINYKQHKIIFPHCKIEIKQLHKIDTTDSLGNFKFNNLKQGVYKFTIYGQPQLIEIANIHLDSSSLENIEVLINANDDWVSKEIAAIDIKIGKPKLLLAGGITPIIYNNQHKFEKKYHVKYYDYGDLINVPFESMEEYNNKIFEYLDSKYGKKWRLEIRKDVIGLKK
ncbi:MAG: hypothetical protein WCL51_17595 [Bacteroidota bacterium]